MGRGGGGQPTDGIIMARLDGTAGYCVHNKVPVEEAVEQLLEIAGGRMDLVDRVAGIALGGWEVNDVESWSGAAKANLLLAAGADPEGMRPHRREIVARLSTPFVDRHPTSAPRKTAEAPPSEEGGAVGLR